jgi:hypothetical protein
MKAATTREIFKPDTPEEKVYYSRYDCIILFEKDIPPGMTKVPWSCHKCILIG